MGHCVRVAVAALAGGMLGFIVHAANAAVPALRDVPPGIAREFRDDLVAEHDRLAARRDRIKAQVVAHNQRCTDVEEGSAEAARCTQARGELQAAMTAYGADVARFHQALGWRKALGCAMDEVYARAEALGPDGVRFASDLRGEMARVGGEAGKSPGDRDDVGVVVLKLDRQVSVGSGDARRQFVVEAAVHRKGSGDVDVDVQSHLSGSDRGLEDTQSFLVVNQSGDVATGQHSPGVKACLAR